MDQNSPVQRRRLVQLWLFAVAALMVVTLVVGGATRLTESGLSIVEWKPVTGVLPPLSQADWQAEFDKYKEIPQYRELNRGMGLDAFKTIYWWEWSHRVLARLVGAAFLLPFLVFLWHGWIEPPLKLRLWLLFGAGALLGAVGWWMVASGLAGRVSVSQYRLGFHLTLACTIYAAILWTALRLSHRAPAPASRRHRITAIGLLAAVIAQIYLGALVAGLDAGLTFNTWPLIDGALIPSGDRLWFETPAWRNLFENALTVQFNHRMLAYALWIAAVLHAIDARNGAAWRGALALAVAMTIQAAIGIATLLYQAPISLALLHQAMAIVVLTIAVIHAVRITPERVVAKIPGNNSRIKRFAMIEATRQGDVMVLKLTHGKANALDLDLCEAIAARFNALRTTPDKAIVLTGQGKMFSAGVDLPRLVAGGADYVLKFLPALHKLYDAVFHHPKPVIAAVNGHAIAGGCVLACCADKRIAVREGGRIGVTELLVGVPFPALAFEVMRFATAPQYFSDVIFSGATFPTGEALKRGLVDEIVEPDQLMDHALAAARTLAALPPQTFAMTKNQIRQPLIDRMAKDAARVDALAEKIWTSEETLAHVRDFVARTFKKD